MFVHKNWQRARRGLRTATTLSSLAALGLALTTFVAAADDPVPSPKTTCELYLSLHAPGSVHFSLTINLDKQLLAKLGDLEKPLEEGIGCSLQDVMVGTSRGVLRLTAYVHDARPDTSLIGAFDVGPLANRLQAVDIDTIEVLVQTLSTRRSASRPAVKQYRISTTAPEIISLGFSSKQENYVLVGLVLGGLLAAPLAVMAWRRTRALRSANADRSLVWYGYWRWAHWMVLGTWLAWLTAYSALDAEASLAALIGGADGSWSPWDWILWLLPPALVTGAVNVLSVEVYARLTLAEQSSAEIFRQAAWSLVTTVAPAVLALAGALLLIQRAYGSAALVLAMCATLLGVARLARRGPALSPYLVTTGELRERVAALAQRAGVTLTNLYVVPTGKMPEANGFALLGGEVWLTDHLLRNLSKREVDAVIAHELAHLKFHHPAWLLLVFLVGLVAPLFLFSRWEVPLDWLLDILAHVPWHLIVAFMSVYFVSRRFERQVDSYGAWLVSDPEASITGLIKIQRLNLMPMQWGKWEEHMVTHPSTSQRLEHIARENGVSRQRLEELVADPDQTGAAYEVPEPATEQEAIFSTAFKTRHANRMSWLLIAAALAPPALAACLAAWEVTPIAPSAILAGGLAASIAIVLTLLNFLPVQGFRALRRRLAEKLQAEGIDVAALSGRFVAFSPDAGPRVYDLWTNWDVGFLFILQDRLCYVGEQARFALRREQVKDVHLAPSIPQWWTSPDLHVHWEDQEHDTCGVFNVGDAEVHSMRAQGPATHALHRTLRQWRDSPSGSEQPPACLASLGPPQITPVVSQPVDSLRKPSSLIVLIGIVALFGCGINWLLGLSYSWQDGGLGWYVVIVAAFAAVFPALPLWWGRRGDPGSTG